MQLRGCVMSSHPEGSAQQPQPVLSSTCVFLSLSVLKALCLQKDGQGGHLLKKICEAAFFVRGYRVSASCPITEDYMKKTAKTLTAAFCVIIGIDADAVIPGDAPGLTVCARLIRRERLPSRPEAVTKAEMASIPPVHHESARQSSLELPWYRSREHGDPTQRDRSSSVRRRRPEVRSPARRPRGPGRGRSRRRRRRRGRGGSWRPDRRRRRRCSPGRSGR